MEKWALEKPDYIEKDGYFVIRFRGSGRAEKPLEEDILEDLNDRQYKAVEYLKEKGKITNKEYRELNLGITDKTVFGDLQDLVDKKLIAPQGEKKGRRPEIHYCLASLGKICG